MLIPEYVLEEIKQVKPCYFKNAFPKIFSWNELEYLLNLRPFCSVTRLHIMNDIQYRWNTQSWLSDQNTFPPSLLQTELKQYPCYFADSSRANKPINSICNQLEENFLGGKADAHIYFTITENLNLGFGIHWDYAHNLIVQVEGSTRFQIWRNSNSQSPRFVSSLEEEPVIDKVLNPGDAVFAPMFTYHQALSQTKRLSVSFPISFDASDERQDRHWIQI